jgi:gamma-butyrobetaine dioxygenase
VASVPVSSQALGFPAVWLRHNCPCPDCRDPVTGQRLVDITQLPNGPSATVTAEFADSIEVTFAPDGHRSMFSRAWLAASALDVDGDVDGDGDADARTEDGKVLWRAAGPAGPPAATMPGPTASALAAFPSVQLAGVPAADWASYLADDAVRVSVLDAVARYGAGLLRGVPASDGMVTAVAETFGYVRETNYGRIFDVRVVADPANLAFTSRAIAPHTDNPYRDPVPTLQLLHCLRDASVGGDTVLVDGFAAAAALRAADPASFGVLTSTPISFSYVDKATSLTARQPLIALSPRGRVACVRLNNRSMQPVRLPYAKAEAVYAAYRAWAAIVARPEFALGLRLAPGDCLIFDNTRILHARTAFASAPPPASSPGSAPAPSPGSAPASAPGSAPVPSPGSPPAPSPGPGERHLQGCYADLDGLLSTLAVLRRAQTPISPGQQQEVARRSGRRHDSGPLYTRECMQRSTIVV